MKLFIHIKVQVLHALYEVREGH